MADNWSNRSGTTVQRSGTYAVTAGKVYRLRVDWISFDNSKFLNLTLSGPGVSETNIWTGLKPGYNLPTTNIVFDYQLGNVETKTNYSDPAYSLISSTVLDPSGLNYSGSTTFEAAGTGYFRKLSKTSP